MKISFIIPAYNASSTVEKAIESILSLRGTMNCPDIEIIVVENGSTDDTYKKVLDLSDIHSEIRVFHSEKGVSRARNLGIQRACGEWIVFIDADDICESSIREVLPLLDIYAPDLLVAAFQKGNHVVLNRYHITDYPVGGEELSAVKAWMLSRPTKRMTVWAKIFRTKFLKVNHLFFDEELRYSEDSEYLIRVLNQCKSVIISDRIAYRYFNNSPSVMRQYVPDRIGAYLKALDKAARDIQESEPAMKNAFGEFVSAHVSLVAVHDIFACDSPIPWRQRCRNMEEFLQNPIIQHAVCTMGLKDMCCAQNIPVILFRYHFTNLGGLACYMRSIQNKKRQTV